MYIQNLILDLPVHAKLQDKEALLIHRRGVIDQNEAQDLLLLLTIAARRSMKQLLTRAAVSATPV